MKERSEEGEETEGSGQGEGDSPKTFLVCAHSIVRQSGVQSLTRFPIIVCVLCSAVPSLSSFPRWPGGLARSTSLTSLCLANNRIADMSEMGIGLYMNGSLLDLDMSHNYLADDAFGWFSEV